MAWITDFLSAIQVTIQLTDHPAIGLLLAIQLPDMSYNQMPTVLAGICIANFYMLAIQMPANRALFKPSLEYQTKS